MNICLHIIEYTLDHTPWTICYYSNIILKGFLIINNSYLAFPESLVTIDVNRLYTYYIILQ